jgi:glycosyltransferase involved in cell wall biosynthesis
LDLPPPLAAEAETPSADDPGERGPYLVHAGPLEARDGCAAAVERFLRYQRASRSQLGLLLVGRGRVELRESAHVRVLGDLGQATRRRVIAGARAVLVPSRQEALSPLVLESWIESRPAVACGSSRVLGATLERTGGGLACRGSDEFALVLDLLERDPALADALGRAGREALEAEHALPGVLGRVESALAETIAERTAA